MGKIILYANTNILELIEVNLEAPQAFQEKCQRENHSLINYFSPEKGLKILLLIEK